MNKILKNQTASPIFIDDMGVEIPASSNYTIVESEYTRWAGSIDIDTEINASNIIVNDGTNDLSISDGIRFLKYADRAYIQKDDVDVTRVNTTLNFEGAVGVADDGGGKATVTVLGTSEDEDDRLISVDCDENGCIIDADLLIGDDLCFLKEGEC